MKRDNPLQKKTPPKILFLRAIMALNIKSQIVRNPLNGLVKMLLTHLAISNTYELLENLIR